MKMIRTCMEEEAGNQGKGRTGQTRNLTKML